MFHFYASIDINSNILYENIYLKYVEKLRFADTKSIV